MIEIPRILPLDMILNHGIIQLGKLISKNKGTRTYTW